MDNRPLIGHFLGICVATTALLAPAMAQDQSLDAINRRPREVRADRRSDTILLPLLAKMTPPPAVVIAEDGYQMLEPSMEGWAKAEEWVKAEPQAAAIAAIKEATKRFSGNDPGMAFGLTYGVTSESRAAVQINMHVELGNPATISAAKVNYLERLDWLVKATSVEATRLGTSGEPGKALDLLLDLAYLGRQVADRELFREAKVGYSIMSFAIERMRDIGWLDFRGEQKLTPDGVAEFLRRLVDENGLWTDRIRFPQGDRIGVQQLIDRAYGSSTEADPAKVGPLMARVSSAEQPLKIFNESARWSALASSMPSKPDAERALADAYGDWEQRWRLAWFDPRMRTTPRFKLINPSRQPMVGAMSDMFELFELRQIVRVEYVGSRTALGMLGYYYANRSVPPSIAALRPRFMAAVDADPFNNERIDVGAVPPLYLLRPVKDTQGRPHNMTIVVENRDNFVVPLKDDVWVLYSVGSDNLPNLARVVQNTWKRVTSADYLIWPPVNSLYRQYLKDTDRIK